MKHEQAKSPLFKQQATSWANFLTIFFHSLRDRSNPALSFSLRLFLCFYLSLSFAFSAQADDGLRLLTTSFKHPDLAKWVENHPDLTLLNNNALNENDFLGFENSEQNKSLLTKSSNDLPSAHGFLTFIIRPYQFEEYLKFTKAELYTLIDKRIKAANGYDYNGAYLLHVMQYDNHTKAFSVESSAHWATLGQGNNGGVGVSPEEKENIVKATNVVLQNKFIKPPFYELEAEGAATEEFLRLLNNVGNYITIEGFGNKEFTDRNIVYVASTDKNIKMTAHLKSNAANFYWSLSEGKDKKSLNPIVKDYELEFSLKKPSNDINGTSVNVLVGDVVQITIIVVMVKVELMSSITYGLDEQDNGMSWINNLTSISDAMIPFKANVKNTEKYSSFNTLPVQGVPWMSFANEGIENLVFQFFPPIDKDKVKVTCNLSHTGRFNILQNLPQPTYVGKNLTEYRQMLKIQSLITKDAKYDANTNNETHEDELVIKIEDFDVNRLKLVSYQEQSVNIGIRLVVS
jgi:hypothetical protein